MDPAATGKKSTQAMENLHGKGKQAVKLIRSRALVSWLLPAMPLHCPSVLHSTHPGSLTAPRKLVLLS